MIRFPDTLVKRGELVAFAAADFPEPVHHFVANGYTKVYTVPSGQVIHQHKHKTSHEGVLLLGRARIRVDDHWIEMVAPATLHIPAHKIHTVESITEILWACVWPDAEGATTPEQIDHDLIEP